MNATCSDLVKLADNKSTQMASDVQPVEEQLKSILLLTREMLVQRLLNFSGKQNIESSLQRLLAPFEHIFAQQRLLSLANIKVDYFIENGGFSTVYKCIYRGKAVVVKHANCSKKQNPEVHQRERDAMLELEHKRVIKLLGFFYEADPFFVLEYCIGDLHQYNKDEIGTRNMIRFIYQITEGLAWIHCKNYIHGDIKPENFLVTTDNNIKITDFGMAAKLNKGEDRVTSKVSYGTVELQDPLALRHYTFGKFTDIFSFGVSIFEMSTDKPLLRARCASILYNDEKSKLKHLAEALELGRIKEEYKNEKWQPKTLDNVYLREKISKRIRRYCIYWNLISSMVQAEIDLRPTAERLLRCPKLRDLLQNEGLLADQIDSDTTVSLRDKTKHSTSRKNRVLFPRPQDSPKPAAIRPNTYEWWNHAVLSPLYYEDLNALAQLPQIDDKSTDFPNHDDVAAESSQCQRPEVVTIEKQKVDNTLDSMAKSNKVDQSNLTENESLLVAETSKQYERQPQKRTNQLERARTNKGKSFRENAGNVNYAESSPEDDDEPEIKKNKHTKY